MRRLTGNIGRTWQRWRARLEQDGGERGSFSLEWAIIAPAVLTLIFGAIQAGLYFHARSTALTAAQEGVEAARGDTATLQAGLRRSQEFTDRMNRSLPGVQVSGDRSAERVQIDVRGRVPVVIPLPGIRLTVHQSAQAPVERFTTP
jgi:hypothetical protein